MITVNATCPYCGKFIDIFTHECREMSKSKKLNAYTLDTDYKTAMQELDLMFPVNNP